VIPKASAFCIWEKEKMVSLSELKDYIRQGGAATESVLSAQFETPQPMIAAMCERLAQKGLIAAYRVGRDCGCSGSCECSSGDKPARAWRWCGPTMSGSVRR